MTLRKQIEDDECYGELELPERDGFPRPVEFA